VTLSKIPLLRFKQLVLNRKWQVALILILLLGATATWRYIAKKNGSNGYQTARVEYGDIMQTISDSGNVEPVQAVTLTFKSQGYVESCSVHVGDRVKAGQVLAVEKNTDLQAQFDQAEASLQSARANYNKLIATQELKIAQAKAELDQAKSNLDISKATLDYDKVLLENGMISQADLDAANNSYQAALSQYITAQINFAQISSAADIEAAAAQVKSAQAQVTTARDNLNNSRIIAPFDGYVAEINGNVGQWTGGGAASSSSSNSDSSQFYIYLSSTDLQLSAKINEADISKVKIGQKVTFTVDTYPDKTFTGKIAYLAPMATTVNNVQMFDAKITIDDYSLLKSGLPASIKIIVNSVNHVLTVPQEALSFAQTYMREAVMKKSSNRRSRTQTGSGGTSQSTLAFVQSDATSGSSFVVVLQNGQPRLQRVQTGISDDLNVEIKSGLQQGDTIIIRQLATNNKNNSSSSQSGSGQRSSGMGGMPGVPGMGTMGGR